MFTCRNQHDCGKRLFPPYPHLPIVICQACSVTRWGKAMLKEEEIFLACQIKFTAVLVPKYTCLVKEETKGNWARDWSNDPGNAHLRVKQVKNMQTKLWKIENRLDLTCKPIAKECSVSWTDRRQAMTMGIMRRKVMKTTRKVMMMNGTR